MRVLNIVHSFDRGGGIETFLLNVFRALDHPRVKIDLCYTGPRAGSLEPEAQELGVNVWGCRWGMDGFRFMRRLRAEMLQRGPYDVVHAHSGHYAAHALRVAQRLGVPRRLAHFHNTRPGHRNDWKRRLYISWVRKMVLKSATDIVGCAWAALEYHLPHRWKTDPRMSVIRYGVPVEQFIDADRREAIRAEFKIPNDAPIIAHIGRFVWLKNQAGLIKAARRVVDRCPTVRFMLIGDGPLQDSCVALTRELGLGEHVIFTGMRRDIPELLSAADLFTLPSVTEGHPVTLIEAQAAGLPIVASSIPSARETVAESFWPYLRPADDLAGLADSMIALLRRRGEPELRDAARAFGRQFSIRNSCQALLAAWGMEGVVAPPDPSGWAAPRSAQTPDT